MTGLEAEAIFEQLGGRKYEEACRRGWIFDKLDLYVTVAALDHFHILPLSLESLDANAAVEYVKKRLGVT